MYLKLVYCIKLSLIVNWCAAVAIDRSNLPSIDKRQDYGSGIAPPGPIDPALGAGYAGASYGSYGYSAEMSGGVSGYGGYGDVHGHEPMVEEIVEDGYGGGVADPLAGGYGGYAGYGGYGVDAVAGGYAPYGSGGIIPTGAAAIPTMAYPPGLGIAPPGVVANAGLIPGVGLTLPLGLESIGMALPGPQGVPTYGTGVGYGKCGAFRNRFSFDTLGLSRAGFRTLGVGGGLGYYSSNAAQSFNNNNQMKQLATDGGNPIMVIDVGLFGGVNTRGVKQASQVETNYARSNVHNSVFDNIIRLLRAGDLTATLRPV